MSEVGKGIHSYRLFNLAIVDVIFTIIGAYLISIFIDKSFLTILLILFIIGIILHRFFNIKTTMDRLIFD